MAKLKSIPSAEKVKTVPTYTTEMPALGLGFSRANVLNVPAGVLSRDALAAAHALLFAVKDLAGEVAHDIGCGSGGSDSAYAVAYLAEIAQALVEAVTDGSDTPPEVSNGD
jgi:hypothetical protein